MTPPDLRQLRYFLAVAEELSFTRAAARLNLVQQALSSAIAQLEDQLGATLLHRTTRRVELSDAGRALVPHARRAVAASEEGMRAVARVVAGEAGRLRLGLAATSSLDLTPRLLRHLAGRHPGVTVEVRHFDFESPQGGIPDGRSDVALVRPPFEDEGLETLELLSEPRYAVLPAGHRLAAERSVRFAQIAPEPWMDARTDKVWCDFWQVAEQRTEPVVPGARCASFDDLFEAARGHRAIGLAPASIATSQQWPGLAFVPVADIAPSSVALCWSAGDDRPIVANAVAAARAVAGEGPRPAGSG